MLNLTINEQKSDLFNDGQTPTPTGLLKNCEAVGLFDDLCHVNPFDETFRRACEQTAITGHTPRQANHNTRVENEQDGVLHTPQVYPNEDACKLRIVECLPNSPPSAAVGTLDVPVVEDLWTNANTNNASNTITTHNENTQKIVDNTIPINLIDKNQETISNSIVQWPPQTIQLVQPQVYAINLPATTITNKQIPPAAKLPGKAYILPKLSTNSSKLDLSSNINNQLALTSTKSFLEQSSASLTPPSQLPIKERLKALCNNNIKSNANKEFRTKYSLDDNQGKEHDATERKRAAAKRYRHKIRNKQQDLLQQCKRLQGDNERLLAENKMLKQQLIKALSTNESGKILPAPAQIQIPPSTIHFVMNIPNVTLPVNNLVNIQDKTHISLLP